MRIEEAECGFCGKEIASANPRDEYMQRPYCVEVFFNVGILFSIFKSKTKGMKFY